MNNLYGTAMIQPLPQKDFEFMNEEQLQNFDFMSVPVDSPTGYILEVDLEYDETLHNIHIDYPLSRKRLHRRGRFVTVYKTVGRKVRRQNRND